MTEESKVSQRYRELPREDPPRPLDDAILAASRRAVDARPAPLVAPGGRRRWYFPLAAAAIIVLAVAVTVHVERQQRDVELAEASVATPSSREEPAPKRADAPAAAASAPPAEVEARAKARPEAQSGMRERSAATDSVAGIAIPAPEQWLQTIADLRQQGRHDEADRQLAEFRKRFPDYRIPQATLEKVERR